MSSRCQICGSALAPGLTTWHLVCSDCSFESSTLIPAINQDDGTLSKTNLCDSLAPLRRSNFSRLCARLETLRPLRGQRLLEVGCAYGWFLDEARTCGADCHGIEADAELYQRGHEAGHHVMQGFFPACLDDDECFDLIVFNDVFEHLPDVDTAMAACRAHLNPGGLLVINLPASSGTLYRLSRLLCRMGRPASFERLWQKGFPSPHLSYFNRRNLTRLAERHGFNARLCFPLASVAWRGLWQRIGADQRVGVLRQATTFAALSMLAPVLAILPPDIEVHIYGSPT